MGTAAEIVFSVTRAKAGDPDLDTGLRPGDGARSCKYLLSEESQFKLKRMNFCRNDDRGENRVCPSVVG